MIIVKLRGGLGNQMFQYAYGKRLSVERGEDLKLDLSWFSSPGAIDPRRAFDLDIFEAQTKIASLPEIWWAKLTRSYFSGFWQEYSSIRAIENAIRKEFAFVEQLLPVSTGLAQQIEHSESVCVHVRRTDFMSADNFVGLEYYRSAVRLARESVPRARFFIFSDDIAWCRQNLTFIEGAIFVSDEHQGHKSANYLRLMTMCSHFVIANSTFSWWAAFLSSSTKKRVFAPYRWFKETDRNALVARDLIPPEWTVVR